jgi:hypothetical protein
MPVVDHRRADAGATEPAHKSAPVILSAAVSLVGGLSAYLAGSDVVSAGAKPVIALVSGCLVLVLGAALVVVRQLQGKSADRPEPKLSWPRPGGGVVAPLAIIAAGAGLLLMVGCGSGGLRVGGAVVDTFGVACESVTDHWCKPGEEVIPRSVCAWLVPGCVGVGGLASVVLDAFVPRDSAGIFLKESGPPVAVSPMREWVDLCSRAEGVPMCDEVGEAWRDGRDVVIVARD